MTKKFKELCQMEPRLDNLYKETQSIASCAYGDDSFCANWTWYKYLKPKLLFLVGYMADNPLLMSEQDYDIAYQELYDLLPGCRNCGCL